MIKHFCDSCGDPMESAWMGESIALKDKNEIRMQWVQYSGGPEICRACVIRILTDDKHPMRQP